MPVGESKKLQPEGYECDGVPRHGTDNALCNNDLKRLELHDVMDADPCIVQLVPHANRPSCSMHRHPHGARVVRGRSRTPMESSSAGACGGYVRELQEWREGISLRLGGGSRKARDGGGLQPRVACEDGDTDAYHEGHSAHATHGHTPAIRVKDLHETKCGDHAVPAIPVTMHDLRSQHTCVLCWVFTYNHMPQVQRLGCFVMVLAWGRHAWDGEVALLFVAQPTAFCLLVPQDMAGATFG
jgi:hypothetical protein